MTPIAVPPRNLNLAMAIMLTPINTTNYNDFLTFAVRMLIMVCVCVCNVDPSSSFKIASALYCTGGSVSVTVQYPLTPVGKVIERPKHFRCGYQYRI